MSQLPYMHTDTRVPDSNYCAQITGDPSFIN